MTDHIISSAVAVITAIIGVAIIAVLVSRQANTSGVITSAGSALAQDLEAAVSPVTGGGGNGLNFGSFAGGSPIGSVNY